MRGWGLAYSLEKGDDGISDIGRWNKSVRELRISR
jgi:hypothetical protein